MSTNVNRPPADPTYAMPLPDFQRDERQFFNAARCYRERHEMTSSKRTWAEWFQERWHESLTEYFTRIKESKLIDKLEDANPLVREEMRKLRILLKDERARKGRK